MNQIARLLDNDSLLHQTSSDTSLKARMLALKKIRRDFSLPMTKTNTNSNFNESEETEPCSLDKTLNFWSPSSILINSFRKYCSIVTLYTGSRYDLAIDGNGLFAIRKKSKLCFTRKGDFQLDNRGKLVTKAGYDVLNHHNNPIFIPPAQEFAITKTGEIFIEQRRINKIKIVNFASLSGLSGKDDIIFAKYLIDIYPKLSADFNIRQGYIERSNTSIIKEVIESFSFLYPYNKNSFL